MGAADAAGEQMRRIGEAIARIRWDTENIMSL